MTSRYRCLLHQRLRDATKAPHRALDQHPLLAPLVREGLSLRQYGDALAALYGVYDPLEAELHQSIEVMGLTFPRAVPSKLSLLQEDLAVLTRTPIATGIAFAIPRTVPQLIGMVYAIEGASMGGRAIARILQQPFPLRFFSGAGTDVAGRWEAFWAFADAACKSHDHELAVASAVSMFRTIKRHLDAAQATLVCTI